MLTVRLAGSPGNLDAVLPTPVFTDLRNKYLAGSDYVMGIYGADGQPASVGARLDVVVHNIYHDISDDPETPDIIDCGTHITMMFSHHGSPSLGQALINYAKAKWKDAVEQQESIDDRIAGLTNAQKLKLKARLEAEAGRSLTNAEAKAMLMRTYSAIGDLKLIKVVNRPSLRFAGE